MSYDKHRQNTGLQLSEHEMFNLIGLLTSVGIGRHYESADALHFRQRLLSELGRMYPHWKKIIDALPKLDTSDNKFDLPCNESEEDDTEPLGG